jgi:hypothetical protein
VKHPWTVAPLLVLALFSVPARAEESGWTDLMPKGGELVAWQGGQGWTIAGDAALDPADPKALTAKPGKGVLLSTPRGVVMDRNLTSRRAFGDIEVHVEFMVPKGSNSGVKFEGLYEVQIHDSYGKKKPTASDCGGVYPRAELTPRYHTTDEGVPPRTNAAKPAGQWQTLNVVFLAPRFDPQGKKTDNARLVKAVLNGQVIHENVELKWPTGHLWRKEKEIARGPLFLQGDHGPVAFRNVRVKAVEEKP